MEAALRLVSLVAVAGLLSHMPAWQRWWEAEGRTIVNLHARWLRNRLEDDTVRPSNHVIANLAALTCYYASQPGCKHEAESWGRALAHACGRQFHPDGGHYERSTAYHQFATEALLIATHALRVRKVTIPTLETATDRATQFLQSLGTPPVLIGDNDDSHFLRPYLGENPKNRSWWLLLGTQLLGACRESPRITLFPNFGLGILREGDVRVTLSSGVGGQAGRGGHAHNDQLSITWALGDNFVVTDPGTSVYLLDPIIRTSERSASSHSTVLLGSRDVYRICADSPFALIQQGRQELRSGTDGSLVGVHHFRSPGIGSVTHTRTVRLVPPRRIAVTDQLVARDGHPIPFDVFWHLAQSWESTTPGDESSWRFKRQETTLEIDASWARAVRAKPATYASRFGGRESSTLVVFSGVLARRGTFVTTLRVL